MVDEQTRLEINRLYWGSDASVGEIAERLGVSRRVLYDSIEPQPANRSCPDCGGTLGFRNRTAAESREASCPDCGHESRLERDRAGGPSGGGNGRAEAAAAADPEIERQERGAALAPLPPRSIPTSVSGPALGGALLVGLAVGAMLGYMARRP